MAKGDKFYFENFDDKEKLLAFLEENPAQAKTILEKCQKLLEIKQKC